MKPLRIALLLGGVALLLVLLSRLGAAEILRALGRVGWYVLPVFLLYAAYQAARALALQACVLRPGRLGFREALAIRLSGEAVQSLTFTGPALAEPTRAWLLTRRGLSLQEGFAAAITEYLASMFVTAGLAGAGLAGLVWWFDVSGPLRGVALGVVVMCGLFLLVSVGAIAARFYLIGTIIAGLARAGVLRGRLRPDMAWINRMEDGLLAVLRTRRVLWVAAAEASAQALLLLELFTMLRALDIAAGWRMPLVIEAASKVVSLAFLFVPLQVGVSEGAYALVFEVMGLAPATGFAVALLRRIRSLVVASAGLATLAVLTRSTRGPR